MCSDWFVFVARQRKNTQPDYQESWLKSQTRKPFNVGVFNNQWADPLCLSKSCIQEMDLMALETKWRTALSSILDVLTDDEFMKLVLNLEKIPQGVKGGLPRGDMTSAIIKYYGTEGSITLIDRLMNELPRLDAVVQQPLREIKDELEKSKAAKSKQTDSGPAIEKKKPAAEVPGGSGETQIMKQDSTLNLQAPQKPKTRDSQDGKAPWEKSIFDLKSGGILETEAIVGKVVKKSELLTSTIKTSYFFLGVADETASIKLMVYEKDLHQRIKEGSSYIFRNLIKDGMYVKVNASSEVSVTKPVNVPEEFEREAESLLYPESPLTSIKDIKSSPPQTHVSVKATVTQIHPVIKVKVQHKKTNQQRFNLKQEAEEISVTMWGEATEQSKDLLVGDVVLLTNMKPNEYFEKVSLNSTKFTKITKTIKIKVQTVGQVPEVPWITLKPEVICGDDEDTPIYSLESDAGRSECGVSGLRWVCKEKVSLKYQFVSWEEHMERMEALHFIPGGPLLNVTVIAGELEEAYLPHWICTEDNPEVLGKFSVLHIDACGDVVEPVSEVTPSHVKLSQPHFSSIGVLIAKTGFPININCKVLIFKTNMTFLTLHVYLIPKDPDLQQKIKSKKSSGYEMIEKPCPLSLKMGNHFDLNANMDSAEIYPGNLKLEYEGSDPNFYEVFIENPDSNFELTLTHESAPVWTCRIRKDDYTNTGDIQGMRAATSQQTDSGAATKKKKPAADNQPQMRHKMELDKLETKWRTVLSSILDELTEVQFKKLGSSLEKIPQGVKERRLPGDIIDLIIQYYGTEGSIQVIDNLMRNLPRLDNKVQQLLRDIKDELKKLQEQNQGRQMRTI